MARQARTKSVLSQLSGNTKLEVGSAKVNHAIKKHVSSMVGTDIMAGEATLSNAFNNFFGTMQNTMQNMAKSAHEIDKLEATRFAEEQKKLGAMAGNKSAMDQTLDSTVSNTRSGIDGGLGVITKTDRLKNFKESETNSNNVHYNQAYKEALGIQLGADLYGDMLIKSADWNPADFDQNAKEWWDSKYSKGSGDPTVNIHAEATFQKNIVKLSAEKQVQVITESRAKKETTIVDGLVKRFEGGGEDLTTSYIQSMSAMRSIMPGQSDGAVSSRVLAAMIKGARTSPKGLANFAKFLDTQFIPAGGKAGDNDHLVSLSEKFPSEISALRVAANASHQKYMTQGGTEAITKSLSALSTIASENQNDPFAMHKALTTWFKSSFVNLSSTNGVTTPQVNKVKAEFSKLMLENRQFKIAQSQLHNSLNKGDMGNLTSDVAKTTLSKMANNSRYDFTLGATESFTMGSILQQSVNRFGMSVINDDLKAKIKAGLLHSDSDIKNNTLNMLKIMDQTSDLAQIKDELFKDDRLVGPLISGLLQNQSSTVSDGLTQADYAEAFKKIDLVGVGGMLFQEKIADGDKSVGSKQKLKAMVQILISENGEIFEENTGVGDKAQFGNPPMSLGLETKINQLMKSSIAEMLVAGTWETNDDSVNQAKVMKLVATKLKGDVVYFNGKMQHQPSMSIYFKDHKTFGKVPIGNNVKNPLGNYEDVYDNMEVAVKDIKDGLTNLTDADADNFIIRKHKSFELPTEYTSLVNGKNVVEKGVITGYAIYDKDNPSTPLGLQVGKTLEVQPVSQFDAEGNYTGEYNLWQRQRDTKVKLTGEYKTDLLMMRKYLNPYIVLIPYKAKGFDGKYTGYHLGVLPHFKEEGAKTLSNKILQNLLTDMNN